MLSGLAAAQAALAALPVPLLVLLAQLAGVVALLELLLAQEWGPEVVPLQPLVQRWASPLRGEAVLPPLLGQALWQGQARVVGLVPLPQRE